MSLDQTVEGIARRYDSTRGILFVSLSNGKEGYVPSQELSINDGVPAKIVSYLIGKRLFYKITEFDGKTYMLSRKALALETIKNLQMDKPIQATITNIWSSKIFVDYMGLNGLCLMQEFTYGRIPDTSYLNLQVGDVVDFSILGKNLENKLLLSHKQAFGTLGDVLSSYSKDDVVVAKIIDRVNPEKDSECISYFALIDELGTGIVDVPREIHLKAGQTVSVYVKKICAAGLRCKFMSI